MQGHWITVNEDDSTEIPAGTHIARVTLADPTDAAKVMLASPDSDDGRSAWCWLRLVDGTLALATFPQGDTYLEISDAGKAPFWPD